MPKSKKHTALKESSVPGTSAPNYLIPNRLALIQSKAKVAKPVTKVEKSRRGAQHRPLSLKLFFDLPLDVAFEICSNLEPIDLLNLSRVSKSFRAFLMSRSTLLVWRRVLEGVDKLPKCPEDLTEPQYASLIFDDFCMGCGTIRGDIQADYALRLKLCKACYKVNVFSGHGLRRHCGPGVQEVLSLLPSGSQPGSAYLLTGYSSTMNDNKKLYFLPEAKLIFAELEARKASKENSPKEHDKFVSDRQAIATRMIREGALIRHWVEVEERRQENEELISNRRECLQRGLLNLGCQRRFFPGEDHLYRAIWDGIIEIPEYFTTEGFNDALASLKEIHDTCKSMYLMDLLLKRMMNFYAQYRARQPTEVRQQLPPFMDVMWYDCVKPFLTAKWDIAETCTEDDLVPLFREIQHLSTSFLEDAKRTLLECIEGFDDQDKSQSVEPRPTMADIGKAKVVFFCSCDHCIPDEENQKKEKRKSKGQLKEDPHHPDRAILPYPDIVTHWVDKHPDSEWSRSVRDLSCIPEIVRAAGDVLDTLGMEREVSWAEAKPSVGNGLVCDCDDVRCRGVIEYGKMVQHICAERQLYQEINALVLPENKEAASTELVDGHRADRLPALLRRPRASYGMSRKARRGKVEWNYSGCCAACYKLTRMVTLLEKGTDDHHMRMMHGRPKVKGDMVGIEELVARYGKSPPGRGQKSKRCESTEPDSGV